MKTEDRTRILKAIATGRAWMEELVTARIASTDRVDFNAPPQQCRMAGLKIAPHGFFVAVT